jgi:DNA-binding transcriptional LysR family regulator
MGITIRHLEIFRAIVVSGSISRAKRNLGLSQPTISQQLAKMEETLGVQLVHRNRATELQLTQAGEYWYKVAQNILGQMSKAEAEHRATFSKNTLELRFGTTPSLRGRFMEKAAQVAVDIPQFTSADFVWGLTSDDLVEMLATHRLNCAILSETSIQAHRSSLHVEPLFRGKIVFVSPRDVNPNVLSRVIKTGQLSDDDPNALQRYVDVGPSIPWHLQTEQWYRDNLPFARPYFKCMTHQAAVDIVAAGLATCHMPLVLYSNLPINVRERLWVHEMDMIARDAVLVMPKHLLTLQPFAEFQRQLAAYVKEEYLATTAELANANIQEQ